MQGKNEKDRQAKAVIRIKRSLKGISHTLDGFGEVSGKTIFNVRKYEDADGNIVIFYDKIVMQHDGDVGAETHNKIAKTDGTITTLEAHVPYEERSDYIEKLKKI